MAGDTRGVRTGDVEADVVGEWMVSVGVPTASPAVAAHILHIGGEMRRKAREVKDEKVRLLLMENVEHVIRAGMILGAASGAVISKLRDHVVAHEMMED